MSRFDSESSLFLLESSCFMLCDLAQSPLFDLQWLTKNQVVSEFTDLLLSTSLRLHRRCAATMGRHMHSDFMVELQYNCIDGNYGAV